MGRLYGVLVTVEPVPTVQGVRRAAAARNRQRVFAAAKECFAVSGADAGMEEIARRAGVGVGTLYRNYGSRSGLVRAIYTDMLDGLAEEAAMLTEQAEPAAALTQWLSALGRELVAKHSTLGDLRPLFEREPAVLAESHARGADAVRNLLEPLRASGRVRRDVTAEDLMHVVVGVAGLGAPDASRVDHLLDLVLNGVWAPGDQKR